MRAFRPDVLHIDDEPYNLATWQALWLARRTGCRALFFSWQNIRRRYPPPFSLGERYVLRGADHAIAGTESAADVLRAKSYGGPLSVIPQFGIDPQLFRPPDSPLPPRPFTLGYFGRLVPEKRVGQPLAGAGLAGWRESTSPGWRGAAGARTWSHWRNAWVWGARVDFCAALPSAAMPAQYHQI